MTAPITGNEDLDAFLYNLSLTGVVGSGGGSGLTINKGAITLPDGAIVGYKWQYIGIKYADDNVGTGISDSPTGKSFYGVYNTDIPMESTNPADYTWYEVQGGFGTTRNLYYQVYGGRNIKFLVDTAPPYYKWLLDNGLIINLDNIVPSKTISTNEILAQAITDLELAAGAVTAAKTNIAAIDVNTGKLTAAIVENRNILDGAITELKIAADSVSADKIQANAVTTNKIEAGAVTTDKIQAGAVTADKITVNNLAAITANLGAINAGSLNINNKFIVEPNGNTTIRSATTGARLEIKNNTIKVYDNAGTLRVHIGDLSA